MTILPQGRSGRLALLVAAAAAYVLAPRLLDLAARPVAGVAARAIGQFVAGGDVPASRGIAPDGDRWNGEPRDGRPTTGGPYWSSWNGSDGGRGALALGPFPAPAILGVPVCGYPHVDGNRLVLENPATSEAVEVAETNIGGDWECVLVRVPPAWRGQPVVIRAVDGATGYYGWLAVGAPRAVAAFAAGWTPFARKVHGFAGAALALLLLHAAATSLLRGRAELPPPLLALAGFAAVALAGYAVFWVFFASAPAGRVLSWGLLAACAWRVAGPRSAPLYPPGAARPLLLMAAAAALYLGLLSLYGADRTVSDLGAHRFIDNLAYDNDLPDQFADRLIHGEDPRRLTFGWWSSSDRPPLQAAVNLIVAYPLSAAGVAYGTAAQATGILMQLTWICAAWGWLCALGLGQRPAALVIASLLPAGFFLVNTLFVWPKLLAGGLVLGAFTLWLGGAREGADERRHSAAWGTMATLGYLAHAAVAFSILGWLPLAAARMRLRRPAAWLPAAAVFAALVLPWMAYQRYYNPPANFLLKLHFAGALTSDESKGTWETIVAAYRAAGPAKVLRDRISNVDTLFRGPWADVFAFRASDLPSRRNGEYYGSVIALGWWNLGLAAAATLAWRARRARAPAGLPASLAWCLLTLAVWALLMFRTDSTVIHAGSYACEMTLFLCAASALWRLHPAAFALVALAELAVFAQVWVLPNPSRVAALHGGAAAVAVLGALAMAAVVAAPGDAGGPGPLP